MRDLRRLLAAADSDDWRKAEEAVDELGERLGALSERDAKRATTKLVALSRHKKWEVRRAVARAAVSVRGEALESVVAQLSVDENSWVRDAARRTIARRTERARTNLVKEQHDDLLARWLAEIELSHGARAVETLRRAASKYAELLMREAYHEIVKAVAPLDLVLTNLERELEQKRVDRAASRGHLERAKSRLRLLTAMLTSLRALTTEVVPQFEHEELREVVSEAVALIRERNRKKIKVEIAVAKHLAVELHRVRILQVFTNVLQNALESYDGLDRRPWLRVTATIEGPRVLIQFVDRGCGMSDEALQDVFNLYASKKPDGLGFGLTLARKIIETEHKGSIRLESKSGAGTTVTITLPLEQEAAS